jgi:tRNA pseudouridine32 synthase/23S rRNA pseudouridine746 synthase
VRAFPAHRRAQWQDRFARGRVQDAQGRALAPDMPWQVGLEIQYFREVADEPVIPFAETILHLDAHLLVADKPHFLPVTPAGGHVRETLLARLVARTGNADLVPLHRLDRLTAGLVLFSTQRRRAMPTSGCSASGASKRPMRRWHRRCRAGVSVAAGQPPGAGRAVLPHGRSARRANARSRIELIEAEGPIWRYRLLPETGRKHQLRVHMAMLGAPIEGDDLYPQLRRARTAEAPLQLLAQGLAFDDPLSGEPAVQQPAPVPARQGGQAFSEPGAAPASGPARRRTAAGRAAQRRRAAGLDPGAAQFFHEIAHRQPLGHVVRCTAGRAGSAPRPSSPAPARPAGCPG